MRRSGHRRCGGLGGDPGDRPRRRDRRLLGRGGGHPAQARALIDATGVRGLAGDLFVDGALGSRTAWLSEPYADAAGCTGNRYLAPETIAEHLAACTEAGVTAGFHVIGDAALGAVVDAIERTVERFGAPRWRALRPSSGTCGDGVGRAGGEARRLGIIASVQPASTPSGEGGTACTRAVSVGPCRRAQPAGAVSIGRRAPGYRLRFPVTSMDPWSWVRAASRHRTPAVPYRRGRPRGRDPRAWRAGGVRDGVTGTLVPGAPASAAVWETGALDVTAPADAVARWSTDPRSRVPALPDLDSPTSCHGAGRPCTGVSCSMAERAGVHRWGRGWSPRCRSGRFGWRSACWPDC